VETQIQGLTTEEVNERIARSEVNTSPDSLTRTVPQIIRDHTFTLFNALLFMLFVLIMAVGEHKNGLFILIAVANTVIGAFQDIRAKLTIDKLAVITQTHTQVVRDGQEQSIPQEDVVLGDTILLALGNQVTADSKVVASNSLEVDESLLTGESHSIVKNPGDEVYSGSFVVAGSGVVQVTAVGADSYAQSISAVTRYEKKSNSQLMRIINFIIKFLAFVLIPLSALLFARSYFNTNNFTESVIAMVAAAVGMVPDGLMLLTGVAFAVGAFNLVRHRTLTQSMTSIETLARVDVLCVDKTGTITDGTLTVDELIPLSGTQDDAGEALTQFVAVMADDNETAHALHERFKGDSIWTVTDSVAFSSSRKWSSQSFKDKGSYVFGAPEFVMKNMDDTLREAVAGYAEQGLRTLLLAQSDALLSGTDLPAKLKPVALVTLVDNVRESAKETFAFFQENDVEIKVISGDDPQTVSTIASMAGIKGARHFVDMSRVRDDQPLEELMHTYTVFGRTSPAQKQRMVEALQNIGKTVGMVGDGVNDTMALREADVSVAMASGSDAARTVADFVLVDSDFSSMVDVVKEGRRVVNNIEKVASLYISKTIYTVLLTIAFILLPFEYPFQPIQLTLINFFMIGIPSFFLTFTPNYETMNDRFGHQLLKDGVPAALLVVANIIAVQYLSQLGGLSYGQTSTLSVLMAGIISAFLLVRVSQPYTKPKFAMNIILIAGYFLSFIFIDTFFELRPVLNWLLVIWVPLAIVSYPLYLELTNLMLWFEKMWFKAKNQGRAYKAPAQA